MIVHSLVTNRNAIAHSLGDSFGPPESGVSAIVMSTEASKTQRPVAVVLDLDPLTDRTGQRSIDNAMLEEIETDCIVVWSGSLGAHLFARDIRTWGPAGMEAFGAMIDRLRGPLRDQGKRLLLRPHSRHVLSDAQRTLSFMLDEEKHTSASPFGLALDPVALLEPNMLEVAADHIERSLQALGGLADLVIMSGAAPPCAEGPGGSSPEQPLTRATPVHDGVIDAVVLSEFVYHHVPETTPVVLLDVEVNKQLESLGLTCPHLPGA